MFGAYENRCEIVNNFQTIKVSLVKNKCSVPVDWLLGAEGVEFSGELTSLCEMIKERRVRLPGATLGVSR